MVDCDAIGVVMSCHVMSCHVTYLNNTGSKGSFTGHSRIIRITGSLSQGTIIAAITDGIAATSMVEER